MESVKSPISSRLSTKLIAAIGLIWLPFVVVAVWLEVQQARQLAMQEVERWGVSAGEGVRVALNALMREGKMSARFSYFEDLSRELSEVDSIRVIRGPRVNEIFERVRREIDIPRELAYIQAGEAELTRLERELARASDPDERADIVTTMDEIKFELTRSRDLIEGYSQPLQVDPRSRPKDELEHRVLETAQTEFAIDGDLMRMIAPYKVRKNGCSEASGCHFGAAEGEVLGAVELRFSIAQVNRDIRGALMSQLAVKILASLASLILIFLVFDRLVFRHISKLRSAMERLSAGDLNARCELPHRRMSGDEIDYLVIGFNDMANKLQDDQGKLERLANHDGLTGLLNRSSFTAAFNQLLASRRADRPLSVLMMDVDHFKNINDSFGHQVGDDALRMVSAIVRENARQQDLVARYGGEEIMIVLPDTSAEVGLAIAERLRAAIAARPLDDRCGDTLHLTVSIGVAELPRHAANGEELIRAADVALYQAKNEGRNRVAMASVREGNQRAALVRSTRRK
jgi:diguanylate cyclase (GGDEF)-like protein